MSVQKQQHVCEELERIEQAISDRIKRNPDIWQPSSGVTHNVLGGRKRTHRQTLLQQHEVARFLKQYEKQTEALRVSLSAGHPILEEIDDPNRNFQAFDRHIKRIKTDQRFVNGTNDIARIYQVGSNEKNRVIASDLHKSQKLSILSSFCSDLSLSQMFSDPECYGKFLDLVSFHNRWLNLNDEKPGYLAYLDRFQEPLKADRRNPQFLAYISDLSDYLECFYKKTNPLKNPDRVVDLLKQDIQTKWEVEKGDFNKFTGTDLYCDACQKEFSKESVFNAHLSGKKHVKNAAKMETGKPSDTMKQIFLHERFITEIAKLLSQAVSNTKAEVERKQRLTVREKMLESDSKAESSDEDAWNENSDASSDDEYESHQTNNPLKLPLGPDGRPVPYWLWKIQGLSAEFSCEICGNHKYQGRKGFNNHFFEARHLHGLKCIGIDSDCVNVLKGITNIEEAKELWKASRKQLRQRENEKENTVEVEDEEGNVMNEKDYLDLKRQGLL